MRPLRAFWYARQTEVLWKSSSFVPLWLFFYECVKKNHRASLINVSLILKKARSWLNRGEMYWLHTTPCKWIFTFCKYWNLMFFSLCVRVPLSFLLELTCTHIFLVTWVINPVYWYRTVCSVHTADHTISLLHNRGVYHDSLSSEFLKCLYCLILASFSGTVLVLSAVGLETFALAHRRYFLKSMLSDFINRSPFVICGNNCNTE